MARREKENWVCRDYHFDGTPMDLNNPSDIGRLQESLIKGIEGIGYIYVNQADSTEKIKAV